MRNVSLPAPFQWIQVSPPLPGSAASAGRSEWAVVSDGQYQRFCIPNACRKHSPHAGRIDQRWWQPLFTRNAMMPNKTFNRSNDGGGHQAIVFLEDICIELFVRGEEAGAITATDADFSQFFQEH